MKRLLFLIVCLLLLNPVMATNRDTLVIETSRVKGFGGVFYIISPLKQMDKDNAWYATLPEVKNLPTHLKRFMFATKKMDFLQHTYQHYHLGNLTEQRFSYLQQSWNWHPDSTKYTKQFVKVDVAMSAGINEAGEIVVYVDRNNNYDLGDDQPIKIPPRLPGQNYWGRYNDTLPIEVEYEYYDGQTIKKSKVWLYIDISYFQYGLPDSQLENTPVELAVGFAEYRLAEFELNGHNYKIGIKSPRAVYRQESYFKLLNENTKRGISDQIEMGQLIKLGDQYYRFADVSIDGKFLTLIKEKESSAGVGSQVGLQAIDFKATTMAGETIRLSQLRGDYVLLVFWGTWCPPCVAKIPELKTIYAAFGDKNFEIIGVAKDKKEALQQFIKERNIRWPQILQDESRQIINLYSVTGYPTMFLIDPHGKIIDKNIQSLHKRLNRLWD
ncbi:MAG: redoxin domain-containing protein [Caldithrix sp.]|nr:redoxin domain-containing protein [Caldithrix sp.]